MQNASDQARVVAKRLAGGDMAYSALPWFWSDQGDLKLQIAGLLRDADTFVTRGEPDARAFSVFAFAGDTLRAVESVNRGGEHMAARRIIADGRALTPGPGRRCALRPEGAGDGPRARVRANRTCRRALFGLRAWARASIVRAMSIRAVLL